MTILSHRGLWKTKDEQNTLAAFERSFRLGFGTETDFRDRGGRLVVAHDPEPAPALDAADFFALLAEINPALPLAINIKADGLQTLLLEQLVRHGISNYFLFDMSVPDAMRSLAAGLRCFTRRSDQEPAPAFAHLSAGVWLDSFSHGWLKSQTVAELLEMNKLVCVVSPELHKRPHLDFWQELRDRRLESHPGLMLCTDRPEEAARFFSPPRS